jgi:hypothetical protein
LPAAFKIAATYAPAGWKPALHETITLVTGNESCGALPIARPGIAFTPGRGLAIGCKLLRKKLDAMDGDTTRGLLAWNGGGNPAYPAQVLARRARYL